jgi:methionyl-tRNA formyltransferase
MRLVFMGTPEAAVPTLRRCLEDGHEVVAVWTQPDKPAGRGNKVHESAVKAFARRHGLTIHQPSKIKTEEAKQLFASHQAEVAVVVAYGRILPGEYLSAPRRGCINVHFSLLPLYRGAAPVNWAIVQGETRTGVTTMFVEEELDSGPILQQRETNILAKETATELMARLAHLGADLLSETLARLNSITPRPQRDRDATFAPMLVREDGRIRWTNDAFAIERAVRGMQPWPGAFTHYKSRRLMVWNSQPLKQDAPEAVAGQVLVAHGDDLLIKCGYQTALRLMEVQIEGSRRMSIRDFLNGMRIQTGDKLGTSQ